MSHSYRLLPGLFLILMASGCHDFVRAKFNRGEGVGEEGILVVPFSEPSLEKWYGESENGQIAAIAFKTWARENADASFPEGEEVGQVLRQVADWPKKEISANQWRQLTAALGVKYVLYGQIESLTLERPNRIGLLEPRVEASYRVVNVHTARLEYEDLKCVVEGSGSSDFDPPQVFLGGEGDGRERARKIVLAKLGERIGKDLYGYYSE